MKEVGRARGDCLPTKEGSHKRRGGEAETGDMRNVKMRGHTIPLLHIA
jgi:hypothetical protein